MQYVVTTMLTWPLAKVGLAALTVCCVAFWSQSMRAETMQEIALRSVIAECTNPPNDAATARERFVALAWEEGSMRQTAGVLMSAIFAFRLNLDDLPDSFRNAELMAASMLGNSSLGPNQLSFSSGPLRLAVTGVDEGHPQCILAGPVETVAPILSKASGDPVYISKGGQTLGLSFKDRHAFMLAVSDRDALLAEKGQFVPDQQAMFEEFIASILPPALVMIHLAALP